MKEYNFQAINTVNISQENGPGLIHYLFSVAEKYVLDKNCNLPVGEAFIKAP